MSGVIINQGVLLSLEKLPDMSKVRNDHTVSKVGKGDGCVNMIDCPAHPGFPISWDEKFPVKSPGKISGTSKTFSFVRIVRKCPHCKAEEVLLDRGKLMGSASKERDLIAQSRRSMQLSNPTFSLPEQPAPRMTKLLYFGGPDGRNRLVKDCGAGQRLTFRGGLAIFGVRVGNVQHGSPVGATMADCKIPASGRIHLYSVDTGMFDGRLIICGLRFSVDVTNILEVAATSCQEVTRVFQDDDGLEVQIKSICSDLMLDGITFLCCER